MSAVVLPPLALMIHGAGGGGWEYRFWKERFEAKGYQVIAPDLLPVRGKYESTKFDDYVYQIVHSVDRTPDVLIGASMGGVLVMKAAEQLHPKALVLVCSTLPKALQEPYRGDPYPETIHWRGGPYSDTVSSMPDSDEATRRYAWPRWRDEAGAVLNSIRGGVEVQTPTCPVLSVIPSEDDTIPPSKQEALAKLFKADIFKFAGMSHVGPLLSTKAGIVAETVLSWLSRAKKKS